MNIHQLNERLDNGQPIVIGMVRSVARKLSRTGNEEGAQTLLAASETELPEIVQQLTEEVNATENSQE